MIDLIVRNATIYNPFTTFESDIAIDKGRIVALGRNLSYSASREIDAKGLLVMPAAVDAHVHMQLRLPNFVSSDTFESGTKAAVYGGVTSIVDFAYQSDGERLTETLEKRLEEVKNTHCDVKLHIGITELYDGIEKDIAELISRGYNSFKIHMNDPRVNDGFLYEIYKILAKHTESVAVVHCEEGQIIEKNIAAFKKAGRLNVIYHPLSRPNYVEAFAVRKIVDYAKEFGVKTYIVHTSTSQAKDIIAQAKRSGAPILAETCPQYIYLTEEMYHRDDGFLHTCSPPFRRREDNIALIKGITEDIFDTVATDHCPFWKEDKLRWDGDFTKLPYGIPGVETLYPLMLNLSITHSIPINKLVEKLAYNPARIFGFTDKGEISIGASAEFVGFKKEKYTLSIQNLHMNTDFTPYEGFELFFKPVFTVNKEKVYEI